MKLLTALITSAICLVPSVANASPLGNRQVILETFCSYPTLSIRNAQDDCVEVAFEADSKGYDVYAIKRTTDRFTSRAVGMGINTVSAWTNGKIEEFVARNAH
jgi:hypothetical protein